MLFVDTTVWEVILICITSVLGIFGVSAALEGYLRGAMAWYLRIISAAGGLLLIYPGLVTDAIGLVLIGIVIFAQFVISRKNTPKVA